MAHSTSGRHRAPGRHNPVAELSTIASRAGVTGAKASAVLAASGGLVAAFALPASAVPETARSVTKDVATSAPVAPAAAAAAPAISAPAVSTPVKGVAVGVTGVTAVAKPKPKPKPKPKAKPVVSSTREGALVANAERSSDKASRSTTRTSISSSAKQSSSQVVNIARTLLGIAYVYGGDDASGFDCSGFTQYVFRKAGISLPRTASAQQREGTRVSNPQPGDLVFYGSPAWHVGIYTGGDMMIDSPRTGKSTSERNMFGTPTEFRRY
ncbi:C40 family peptidase [Knoellia sp. CPCC 206450]|uniref:C40 family peptidase n=1 Tax=Knoellia tibetensis TaxID=3404798 RepID=UPI003B4338B8